MAIVYTLSWAMEGYFYRLNMEDQPEPNPVPLAAFS